MTREEAIAELETIAESTVWADRKEAAEMAIKALQERKTGKWMHLPNVWGAVFCSECNYDLRINDTKYCPNCGAKMEVNDE